MAPVFAMKDSPSTQEPDSVSVHQMKAFLGPSVSACTAWFEIQIPDCVSVQHSLIYPTVNVCVTLDSFGLAQTLLARVLKMNMFWRDHVSAMMDLLGIM